MPMNFTDFEVLQDLKMLNLSTEGTPNECRKRLADYMHDNGHYVEEWEIRNAKGWNKMTSGEAMTLVSKHPELKKNPGIRSRLVSFP